MVEVGFSTLAGEFSGASVCDGTTPKTVGAGHGGAEEDARDGANQAGSHVEDPPLDFGGTVAARFTSKPWDCEGISRGTPLERRRPRPSRPTPARRNPWRAPRARSGLCSRIRSVSTVSSGVSRSPPGHVGDVPGALLSITTVPMPSRASAAAQASGAWRGECPSYRVAAGVLPRDHLPRHRQLVARDVVRLQVAAQRVEHLVPRRSRSARGSSRRAAPARPRPRPRLIASRASSYAAG